MRIRKVAYTRYKERFSIEIDGAYRQKLTERVNELIVNENEKIDLLTEQDIKEVMSAERDDKPYGFVAEYTNPKLTPRKMKWNEDTPLNETSVRSVGRALFYLIDDDLFKNLNTTERMEIVCLNNYVEE